MAGRRLFAAAFFLVTAGCAGIFQRAMPENPAHYAIEAPAAVLRVGSAERDVTPPVGGYLAGFDPGRRSTGVESPLTVRALVFVTDERSFAIVGIDNLGLMRGDVDWIKSGIEGFALGDVFLCASHTHAGPDLIGLWGSYLLTSGRDRAYLASVRRAVAEAVGAACAAAVPARLVVGRARLPAEGLLQNSNRPGVFDRRVVVLQARSLASGRPVGSLLHLACHPEILRRKNTEISSDFVGVLCDRWRARGHGQAVFCNGALGALVSPAIHERDSRGVAAFGERLCDVAERALAAAEPIAADEVAVRRSDVYVPVRSLAFRVGRLFGVLPRELFGGCARSTVGLLRLGSFVAAAVPGEMEPALAERLRARLGLPELVVLGLCDDELGYLLREQDARDPLFAYERSMSPCLRAGELVVDALVAAGWRYQGSGKGSQ